MPTIGLCTGVGTAVEDVIDDALEDVEDCEVDTTELEVLLGATVPIGAHVAPREAGSLKSSANKPLLTPYFVPAAEAMVELPL